MEKVIIRTQKINKRLYEKLSYVQKKGSETTFNIAVSEAIKEDLKKAGIKVHMVISNSVNTEVFKNLNLKRDKDFLFAGSFSKYAKGFDILEQLVEKGFNIDCLTNGLYKESKLNFLPHVSQNEIAEYYNKYKILIFPSRYESFGLVPLEAMACGMPVIMNYTGIGKSLVKFEEKFVAMNNNTDEYETQIKEIMTNYEYYSKKAEEIVKKNYSFQGYKDSWIKLIKERVRNG